jgi:hypothetical protein
MKRRMNILIGCLLSLTFILLIIQSQAQVSINSDGSQPDPAAMLEVKSNTKGLLLPRLTQTNRPSTPPAGLIFYQTTAPTGIYMYDGSWSKLGLSASDYWLPLSSDIYFSAGKVGIGTTELNGHGLSVSISGIGKAAVRGSQQDENDTYAEGFLGYNGPSLPGAPITVNNAGIIGKGQTGGNTVGVFGWNGDYSLANYAGLFVAMGPATGVYTYTNYGIYAKAVSASQNYAGKFVGRVEIESNRGPSGARDSLNTLLYAVVKHANATDTKAIHGESVPKFGRGIGVLGEGGLNGVRGVGVGGIGAASATGVYGTVSGVSPLNIGVYGSAFQGTVNWAGFFEGNTHISGSVGIGTTDMAAGYTVSVNGKVACEELLIQDMLNWPDYVFNETYNLLPLDEVESCIRSEKHLPGMPSAKEIENTGVMIGDMQKKILEKVEELTLYAIDQDKQIRELHERVRSLESENQSLKKHGRK